MSEDKKTQKIFCVDDDRRNLELLEALLAPHGYEVILEESGAAAMERIKTENPDLVLLDLMMPKVSGMEVLRRIRGEEVSRPIPVIVVTALQEVEDRIRAFDAGCDDFISKPFDKTELLARVKSLLALSDYRHRLKEEEKYRRMQTEFLSVMSHELRTPLTPISGYIQLFLAEAAGSLAPEYKKAAEIISKECQHLLTIIDNMLDVSKLERGMIIELKKEPVSIKAVIEDLLERIRPQLEERDLKVELEIEAVTQAIMADPVKIYRVFTNLLGNAIKFTPAGGRIKIISRRPDDHVEIRFVDNGIGLAGENLERVFDKFFQVDSSYTRKAGGIGMGLTICREIVEAHGGKMWAESAGLGHGAAICFTLPVA